MFALGLGLALVAGCGGESTQPRAEVKVMGGILIARGMPAGAPYQAGAVVSVNGQVVTDAEVRINGAPMVYMANPGLPEQTGFVGQVTAAGNHLSATAADPTVRSGPRCPRGSSPGRGLVPPTTGHHDLWTPASGAVMTIVTRRRSSPRPACGCWRLHEPARHRQVPRPCRHASPSSA
jgi:hypothetical protein